MFLVKIIFKVISGVLSSLGISLLLLLYVVFYTNIPESLFERLEVKPVMKTADVIVVLGAGVTQDGWPSRFSLERAVKGVILYRQGYSKKIIFSGGWAHDGLIPAADAMAKVAKELGVYQNDIIIEDKSHDTHENAEFTKTLMDKYNFKTALLVTSESHMKRSMGVFGKLNVPVFPVPVEEALPKDSMDWKSRVTGFSLLYQVIYESFGLIKYQQNNWI